MMSHALLTCKSHVNHTEGASKQVIIMNHITIMVFEGSFDNFDYLKTQTI